MAPIIPPTNLTIKVGDVGTTLGLSTKNIGGFRGFGGSVPASGAISMSQCQIIQYGVGYYNTWRVPSAGVNQGTWGSTSITNKGSMTCIIWLASNSADYWRNLYHVTTAAPTDSVRRPATWIYSYDTGFHCKMDSTTLNDGIDQTTSRIVHNGSVYMLAITYNSTIQTAYLNSSAGQVFTLAGAPNNGLSTDIVYSPDTYYPTTGNFALNRLWFFPYPMTATQVSNYYTSISSAIGTPTFPPTGGTITVANGYRIHTFTAVGASTFATTYSVTAQTLVVAGGGGGGFSIGGGGGAGGLLFSSATTFAAGSYTITVGAGGAGSSVYTQRGTNGGNSSISGVSITAIGGGGGTGQTAEYNSRLPGGTGGSGGGGSRWDSRAPPGYGLGTTGQGNRGGTGYATGASGSTNAGGGGGGAGAIGGAGTATGTNNASGIGGAGGAGLSITIGGNTGVYAGGGGANGNTGGAGGSGGGGFGTTGGYGTTVGSGTANTGGGGGGGSASVAGGTGGSGIVIIAYLWP